jgi:hypothetical protein
VEETQIVVFDAEDKVSLLGLSNDIFLLWDKLYLFKPIKARGAIIRHGRRYAPLGSAACLPDRCNAPSIDRLRAGVRNVGDLLPLGESG